MDSNEDTQVQYWKNTYAKKNSQFDWIEQWDSCREIVKQYIHPAKSVLQIGCGNSKMSEQMLADPFDRIVNTDIAEVVIQQQKERYQNEPRLEWIACDCAHLPFQDNEFEYVFDKGTLDAVFCGSNSDQNILSTFKEAFRVLIPGGYFIIISLGMLMTSREALKVCSASVGFNIVETKVITSKSSHYFHVLQKPSV